ncbi:MAG TPA: ABC transporter substrate-binding protein [Acetobacteraceae bacterium]|nr:ABC transporter substrate-binding protein [Acetobacteraceae bacterium]
MAIGTRISRRKALTIGAAAGALPLVHIRTAAAAGKVSVGFWDHWVPAGNGIMKKQVDAWAAKNKVEVTADFITSVGNKNLMTIAAEAQARTGHDIEAFPTWEVHNHSQSLEPMDDVMKELTGKYGPANAVCEYLSKIKGQWMAVPSSSGTQTKPACGRISAFKKAGMDPTTTYPAKEVPTGEGADWTYDKLLALGPSMKQQNLPYGIGLGQTSDSVDFAGGVFAAFGATLVDKAGNITVKTDPVRQVLDYYKKLTPFLAPDTLSYDDASNNRALISGKSSLIFNPPSAWAVATRDAPQVAADSWTFPSPAGPKGRFIPYLPYFWGVWNFSRNKTAAKELITYLMERPQVEARANAVSGYDIPPFDSMDDFPIWSEVEPPKGTVYNYPIRKWHGSTPHVTAQEASPDVAVQMYNQAVHTVMIAKYCFQNQSMEQVLAWANNEIEGYMR